MVRGQRCAAVGALAASLVLAACSDDAGGEVPRRDVSGVAVAPVEDVVEVRVGKRRIATRCSGDEGDPPVVLVAPLGTEMAAAWDAVHGRFGTFTRACAYDRPGVGRSGKPPRSQTLDDMATTLGRVIEELELEPPVHLVGASIGGLVAVTRAQQQRDGVAGLLLLDATGPGYPAFLLDRLPARSSRPGGKERDDWEDLLDPADNAERLDGSAAFTEPGPVLPLGSIPVAVLTHSIPQHPASTRPRQQADLESAWEASQRRWLALSSQSTYQRVDLAGHDIANDNPDAVVEALRALVED
jgi:pimeloyl-ACP methyl ester carboxylesterase